jgi:hypothetical protein
MPSLDGDVLPEKLTEGDDAALRKAVLALERPSLAVRLATLAGKPIEFIGRRLPDAVNERVLRAARGALNASLRVALDPRLPTGRDRSGHWHKALAAASGAVGGTFGLSALALELPISTTIILHAIADIARAEGEDLSDPDAALACLEVFAFGGRAGTDDLGDSSYFTVRAALARSMAEAARYVAERGLAEEGAPVLVRVTAQIASRFGLVVSQKFTAQAIPIVGAVAGAAINAAFTEHFQSMAQGHFIIRRLERIYGRDMISATYDQLKGAESR